jgi:hypothetical protein
MRARGETVGESGGLAARYRFYGAQFLLDTISGKFYRVTSTAAFILRALMDGKDQAELPKIVERHFGIDRSRAARDVEIFLSELRSLGIIENSRH